MYDDINNVLSAMRLSAPAVRLRYAFDHFVKSTEEGETNDCVFYITVDGHSWYVKAIDGKQVLKQMTFGDSESTRASTVVLLEVVAKSVYDGFISKLPVDTHVAQMTAGITGVLSAITQHIRQVRPDLDIRLINATGLFDNSYPSTEELVTAIDILDKKILSTKGLL